MAEGRAGLRVWDRLVLVVAWTVTCGFVYLLGVSVGRGTQDQHARPEERVVRLPVNVPAPAPGTPAGSTDEVTFYEKLVTADRTHDRGPDPKGAPAAPPAPADPGAKLKPAVTAGAAAGLLAAARAVGAAGGAPAAAATAKPVPANLAAASKPNPSVIASATHKAPSAAPAKVVATPSKAAPTSPPKSAVATAPRPAPAAIANATLTPDPPIKATPRVPSPTPRAEPTVTANAKPPGDAAVSGATAPKKSWTVTASTTADRYEAEALMHQLKSKGYSAAMVQAAKNGVTQYRVRVGRYGSSAEAGDAARKLQREGLQGATPASTD